jgi:hypothetical protein
MSPPNSDQPHSGWQALLDAAVADSDPPDSLGMIGTWRSEDIWHFRPEQLIEVRVPREPVERLAAEVLDGDVVGIPEVERAIVRIAGEMTLAGPRGDWTTARTLISALLGRGVGAVALGGVISTAVGANGAASPLRLGNNVVVGHLDPSIDEAVSDLAVRHGLPGFRFSDASWWTEDFLDAKEDVGVGAEKMEELEADESWPWLGLVVAAPASGAAIEVAAIAAAQALLGALVLLDQPPGQFWNEPVPWIAGGIGPAVDPCFPGRESREFAVSIDPQHVDGLTRRLDNAESALEGAPARVIDIAAHAKGPGASLLTAVLNSSLTFDGRSEALAKACRLAWLAAASETPDTSFSLARSAARLLAADGSAQVIEQAQRGTNWRLSNIDDWPAGQPYAPPSDVPGWHESITDATNLLEAQIQRPSWGSQASGQAALALGVVQALFFAHGADSDG